MALKSFLPILFTTSESNLPQGIQVCGACQTDICLAILKLRLSSKKNIGNFKDCNIFLSFQVKICNLDNSLTRTQPISIVTIIYELHKL